MKFLLTISVFIYFPVLLVSQNLVLNPSFEEYYDCPYSISDLKLCKHWSTPNQATTDYYHACSSDFLSSVPFHSFGKQQPVSGGAYIGIIAHEHSNHSNDFTDWYTELAQGTLASPLEKDQRYKVSFYISASEYSKFFHHSIGVAFSRDSLTQKGYDINDLNSEMVMDSMNTEVIRDLDEWIPINGIYQAQGGEKFIIIGNVYQLADTSELHFNPKYQSYSKFDELSEYAYYYLDHVVVEKAKSKNDTLFKNKPILSQNELSVGTTLKVADSEFFFHENSSKIYTKNDYIKLIMQKHKAVKKIIKSKSKDFSSIDTLNQKIEAISSNMGSLPNIACVLKTYPNLKIKIGIHDKTLSSEAYSKKIKNIEKRLIKLKANKKQYSFEENPSKLNTFKRPAVFFQIIQI